MIKQVLSWSINVTDHGEAVNRLPQRQHIKTKKNKLKINNLKYALNCYTCVNI
jgi:hypothetical protein